MTFKVAPVGPGLVDLFWSDLEPFVSNACARSNGRYEPHHIRELAVKGEWTLWAVTDGAETVFVLGTETVVYPTGLKAFAIRFGTGDGRENWQHLLDEVLAAAKAQGCILGEGVFRRGWRRVLKGWLHTHEYLERKL